MMGEHRWWRTFQSEVTTTADRLIQASKERIYYQITSVDHTIFIGPDPTVSATTGLAIPAGSSYIYARMIDNEVQSEVWAIGPTAQGDTVTIREDFEDLPHK